MIIVVMGVSGSGKTTVGSALADKLGCAFRDADALHPAENVLAMAEGKPLTDAMREPWLTVLESLLFDHQSRGEALVLACSALKRAYRDRLFERISGGLFVYIAGTRDQILPRLMQRQGHFFPSSLLDSQFRDLQEPAEDEPVLTVPVTLSVEQAVAEILPHLSHDAQTREE
ncbi:MULTISPECIES: gluconokinase [Cohaesibacter]|uniref:gluconokinase n=1 Tax=Cohaesibacter TaxID=655352 RepID=UPI000DE9567F|nr:MULTISPECIES: gluconokinase [Cohaesibacter]TLP46090.1 gluconokinase [Cohaesibacter sp. CAU 1516]